MNVGIFLGDFVPESGGGYTFQAEVLRALADLAGESRHRFVLLCQRPEAIGPDLRSGFRMVAFPGGLGPRLRSRAGRWIAGVRRRPGSSSRLDQVAREAGIEILWFAGAEARLVDLPCLATVWDLQHRLQPWFPEVSGRGTWSQREQFYGTFLRRAAAVITGTEAGREEVRSFYQVPTDRIKILPHPTPRFALEASAGVGQDVLEKYRIPPDYLFYPAQFWSHKNHINLLFAIRKLRDEHGLSFPAVFVGSDKGNHRHVREAVEQMGLSDQVFFPGFVPEADLTSLYRNAFALSYVSYFGPENLPPLEAFALGCPVIASRVSGAEEQLGDAALLADPSDPGQIADCVKRLSESPTLRADLVGRGRERAAQRTGKRFVQGVLAILDDFERVRRCWGG